MHPSINPLGRWLLVACFCYSSLAQAAIHHEMAITLQPAEGVLEVEDNIILPEITSAVDFLLHENLEPTTETAGATLIFMERIQGQAPVPLKRYRIKLSAPGDRFNLHYRGTIKHDLQQMSRDYGGDMHQTPGLISSDGVYLNAASYWFPAIGDRQITFSLRAHLPPGWKLISQGKELTAETGGIGWQETAPQDDIYLIAGPYHEYRRDMPIADAMVFLRSPDLELAERYLAATGQYLDLYSRLLGNYPYAKFALVENFWETGYGMPSFTLLGPQVIRLPFILHSSYPHEILHNWWGNGVYVDYQTGNWGEGLTTYLADHLLREQQGKGAAYRRSTLQRYTDFVASEKDFPLTAFRGRHGQASQAIGYGKSMMFFHMLRHRLGDERFLEGLRHFYRNNQFKTAGYKDLQKAFEIVSSQDLTNEFSQWTTRTGAPALELGHVRVQKSEQGFLLNAEIRQTQPGPAFQVQIPVLVQLEGKEQPMRHIFSMTDKKAQLQLELKTRPLRLKADPQFDLFRQLDKSETPSSLGQLFGADKVLIVLPAAAPPALKSGYQQLAQNWSSRSAQVETVWDDRLDSLPQDRAIWLFGWNNRLLPKLLEASVGNPLKYKGNSLKIGDQSYSTAEHSIALTAQHPAAAGLTLGWLAAHDAAAIPGLGRKLPHYMKYSYLVFEGDAPTNIRKDQWPMSESALNIPLPGADSQSDLPLAPQPPLSAQLEARPSHKADESCGCTEAGNPSN